MKIILGKIQGLIRYNINTKQYKYYNYNEYIVLKFGDYILAQDIFTSLKNMKFSTYDEFINTLDKKDLSNDPFLVRDVETTNEIEGVRHNLIKSPGFYELVKSSNIDILIDSKNLVSKEIYEKDLEEYSLKLTYFLNEFGISYNSINIQEDNKTNKTYFYICEVDDKGLIEKDSEYRISFDLVNSYYEENYKNIREKIEKYITNSDFIKVQNDVKEKLKKQIKIQKEIDKIIKNTTNEYNGPRFLQLDTIDSLLDFGCKMVLTGGDPIKMTCVVGASVIENQLKGVAEDVLDAFGVTHLPLTMVDITKDGFFETTMKNCALPISNGNIKEEIEKEQEIEF